MDSLQLWVVDDDQDYCELMREVLSDDYRVCSYYNADSYQQALKADQPDLVLMDINLPDISGIDLCKQLQQHFQDVAVIFVSGMNTLDERLRAYDAGGVDFIAKPFELKELLAKTHAVAHYLEKKRSLAAAECLSRNMAFQSMSESAQYGCVLQFLRECFLCNNYQMLADAFFNLMSQLDLSTCLEIRVDTVHYFAPQHSTISPIEANIFELLDKRGRLFDFGSRTICNDKHVSFLIKNMPIQDEVLYGRLRDVIAVIVEGLEARVLDIKRQATLLMVMTEIQKLLLGIGDSIQENDKHFCQVLTGIMADIRGSFHLLDMTEDQEVYFAQLVEKNLKEATSASDAFFKLKGALSSVIQVVESSVES